MRAAVGVQAYEGLQHAGDQLIGKGDQADLAEIEMKRAFENGIDGGDQRLGHVVQQMAEADRGQNSKNCSSRGLRAGFGGESALSS